MINKLAASVAVELLEIEPADGGWMAIFPHFGLLGDLHIAETVDIPNMLVTMHMPKSIFRD